LSSEQFQKQFEDLGPLVSEFTKLHEYVEQLIIDSSGKKIPTSLFHYTSAQGLDGIVQSQSLWATDCRFLNDSQEMKDGLERVIKRLSETKKPIFSTLGTLLSDFDEVFHDVMSPHLVSFCDTDDLLSQWRAYGSEACGYCLEFDVSDSSLAACKGDIVVYANLLPVIYDNDVKERIIEEIIDKVSSLIEKSGLTGQLEDLPETTTGIIKGLIHNLFTLPMLAFKNSGFSEEREWRAVFYPNLVQTRELRKFRSNSGIFIPYLDSIFLQSNDERLFQRAKLPISSVRLPPSAGNTALKGLEMYLNSQGFATGPGMLEIKKSAIPLRNQGTINW